MIGMLDDLGPWHPTEDSRYLASPRHAGALDRLEYDQALDHCVDCPECVAAFAPAQGGAS